MDKEEFLARLVDDEEFEVYAESADGSRSIKLLKDDIARLYGVGDRLIVSDEISQPLTALAGKRGQIVHLAERPFYLVDIEDENKLYILNEKDIQKIPD